LFRFTFVSGKKPLLQFQRKLLGIPNLHHFVLTPTASYHIKIMTVACLEQEIQSPEGLLQYQKAPLGQFGSGKKTPL